MIVRGKMTEGKLAALIALALCLLLAMPFTGAAQQRAESRVIAKPATIQTLPDTTYHEALRDLIRKANQHIDLSTFIFKIGPSPGNRPAELVQELIAAKRRGVEVTVILEDSEKDQELNRINLETSQALRQSGVTVLFDNPGRTSHAKLAVIDRRYCLVGSHNLTQSALKYNHEFSLLLDSPALAEEIIAYLRTIAGR